MKIHRCPHCGNKAFTNAEYRKFKYRRGEIYLDNRLRVVVPKLSSLKCPHCEQYSGFNTPLSSKQKVAKRNTALFVISIALICALLIIRRFFEPASLPFSISFIVLGIGLWICDLFMENGRVFVGCGPEFEAPIPIRRTQVRVKITNPKKVKSPAVYGIVFDKVCDNKTFKQTFYKQTVPAEFRQSDTDPSVYDLYLFNREAIPDELISVGSGFSVEGLSGKFVSHGVVDKVYEPDSEAV